MNDQNLGRVKKVLDKSLDGAFSDIEEIFEDSRASQKEMYARFEREMDELIEQLDAPNKAYWKGYIDEHLKAKYEQGRRAYLNEGKGSTSKTVQPEYSANNSGITAGHTTPWGAYALVVVIFLFIASLIH